MNDDPARHHRRSIRLPGFNYTARGAYFFTICAQNRRMPFGRLPVVDMVITWWQRLGVRFPDVRLDEAVVMPHHFHGAIDVSNALFVTAFGPCATGLVYAG